MKKAFSILTTAALVAVAAGSFMPVHAQSELSDGEVRKVDKENRKVTLKHGEIKNIDMPPMTMDFVVKDGKMLDKLKAGDKIRFRAVNDGGKFTVTEIQAAK